MAKDLESTDNMPFGDTSFQITTANEMMLVALIKYSQMLDLVTGAKGEEQLNVDGLINSLIAEGMTKRIKDLVKRHSFEDAQEFIESIGACNDAEEVAGEIRQHEMQFYQKTHDEILSHIPMESAQMELPLFEVKENRQ